VNEPQLTRELREFKPDVVLCDYNMPGYSGLSALRTSRALEPTVPVLMVSGAIAESTAIECLDLGATDYLLKSNLRRLGPAVRRAVEETSRRKEFEARIEHLAHYDALTGLPNGPGIEKRGATLLRQAALSHCGIALIILNLDHFCYLDEGAGRTLSDGALKAVSEMLLCTSPDPTCVARTGADEFALLLPLTRANADVGVFVQHLLDNLLRPLTLGGRPLKISATAGIALYPDDGNQIDSLLGKARTALHVAKAVSPGSFQFHSADITQKHREHWQMESDLRAAVAAETLTLQYQPQFELATGRVCGVEALARWTRADGRVISPSVFIPLAEKSRSIETLGHWALRAGCRTFAAWPCINPDAPLCINVSVEQIVPRFTKMISEALAESGLAPERLELEITESVLGGSTDHVLECLNAWKRLGVRIAIDDFGSGYSNLAYLSKLPIDRLKIDKSLTARVPHDLRETAVVRTVISLARDLGFTVLAEGIESEEQLRAVRDLGCQQVQGFLLAPPLFPLQTQAVMTRPWGMRSRGA